MSKLVAIPFTAFLLSACAVGPHYVTPATAPITLSNPHVAGFASPQPQPTPPQQWWSFFEDQQLTQLIDSALAHNHDIRQAWANVQASRAVFDQQRLEQYPTLTAQAGYQRSSRQQADSNGIVQRTLAESYRVGVDAQWELDLFGRLQHLTASAQARSQAAQAELAQMHLTIAAEVGRHYYARTGIRQQLALATAQVQSWRATLQLTKARVELGSGLPEDQENAHANLLRSEAALGPLQVRLQEEQYRLDVLTGNRPGQPAAMTAAEINPSPLARQLPLGDVDALIRQRPDVVRAERLLAASTEDIGAATAELYPRLNLAGFIGFFALRGGALGSASSQAFEIAPGASWPLLPMGSSRARVRVTEAQAEGALARYQQALLVAQEEVENATARLVQQQERLRALLQSAAHGAAALEIAGHRYRSGAGSYLAVLENQRALYEIRTELAAADTASCVNVIALYQALGWGGAAATAQATE